MAQLREIGTLWIGGPMTWLEHACIKSFADRGHNITLFTYGDVGPIPKGVTVRSGRDIIDTDNFLKYNRKDSYALFADLFRMHMVQQNPGMIWMDSDTYCLRPVTMTDDYVFGFENAEGSIANGVFSAPPDSELLKQLLAFMDDLHPIPPFAKPPQIAAFKQAHEMGAPIHISDMPWGTWGPPCLSYFARETGTDIKGQKSDVFYPVPYGNRRAFLKDPSRVERFITPNSTAINVFGSNKVICKRNYDGLPPPGSFLERLCAEHDVNPSDFPIVTSGRKRVTEQTQP